MNRALLAALLLLFAALWAPAEARRAARPQESPSPEASATATPTPARSATAAPSATPIPTPTPEPLGLKLAFDLSTTFVSQSTGGPGTTPPEGPGFAAGTSLLEPNTPYDALSLVAQTPGNVGQAQGFLNARYVWPTIKASVVFGAGYVDGSTTNAAYWAEPLMPTLNPHLGQQGMPYAFVLPTHAGQDDATAFRGSLLYGDVAASDDTWRLRGGWFDLVQTDRFVFAPVVISDVVPALGPTTQESLMPSYPGLDSWAMGSQALPEHGVDLVLKQGLGVAEFTDADLTAPPGIGVRLTMGSFVVDHGEGTRWSAQVAHVSSGGVPLSSTVLYGSSPTAMLTAQGILPFELRRRSAPDGSRTARRPSHRSELRRSRGARPQLVRCRPDRDSVQRSRRGRLLPFCNQP